MLSELIAEFNGAIKYAPMIIDHPDWTKDDCLKFARENHAKAIAQLREAFARDRAGNGNWHNPPVGARSWHDRIPYCRNLPTLAMIEEALK
jgi:hypothetical protein